jgi:hypothetical protein
VSVVDNDHSVTAFHGRVLEKTPEVPDAVYPDHVLIGTFNDDVGVFFFDNSSARTTRSGGIGFRLGAVEQTREVHRSQLLPHTLPAGEEVRVSRALVPDSSLQRIKNRIMSDERTHEGRVAG